MKVKLSAYEQAINVLSDAPKHVDKKVCAAFAELVYQRNKAQKELSDVHDALHYECDGSVSLPDEIRALRERLEAAEAKAAVMGGDWCAENRAQDRNPCGCCSWCCEQQRNRADELQRRLDDISKILDVIKG